MKKFSNVPEENRTGTESCAADAKTVSWEFQKKRKEVHEMAKVVLSQKERSAIEMLQSQEKTCVEKYQKYGQEAHDPVLKDLFHTIEKDEQKHYDTLSQVLEGQVPDCDCNDCQGKEYNPTATYAMGDNSEEKKMDCFFAMDCIGTEKMVSSEYNNDVFAFENSDVRKLLADIQIEEQNHAEMLFKYRKINGMVA